MSYAVRQLTSADIGAMQALNRLFGEAFADSESYCERAPSTEYLEAFLANDGHIALVAETDATVIGGLVAYELVKFEQERREVYIYDLAVAAPYRQQGVATALIARLRSIAHARGAWVIYVQADLGDEPAIALYEKLGVREDVLHFDIPVERQANPR